MSHEAIVYPTTLTDILSGTIEKPVPPQCVHLARDFRFPDLNLYNIPDAVVYRNGWMSRRGSRDDRADVNLRNHRGRRFRLRNSSATCADPPTPRHVQESSTS